MLKIKFRPGWDKKELILETEKWQALWDREGKRITNVIQEVSGLEFKEKSINAIIYERVSRSHPLSLNAYFPEEYRKGLLVHELCHRLLYGNNIHHDDSFEQHKQINLILYDVWEQLYGNEFAEEMVNREMNHPKAPIYKWKEAWEYVLKTDKKIRKKKFSQLIKISK